ncbi:hypothetical protein RHOFW510R12_03985 [Rhodanobacter sp. FW510-R12]|uniref:hypothetical protein n=1 Tax=Rhodanobacter TaxID=75309 RepID=UPI0004847B6C|nr:MULTISPECIES: hypothetical protein [Rhodanobacter]TAN14609.1 MAG: hypothetical protein EPN35_14925 [Rhodanobacter sp.]UJJ55218.1 hypothetical protein LRK53_02100 [Rhodanobacter thiooxydans]
MKALNHPFELTSEQKKQRARYDFAVVGLLFIFLLIVSATDIEAVMPVVEAALGIAVGFTLRRGTQRGWMHYAEKYQPGATYTFTKTLKLGVLWRALAAWFGGCVVLELLTSMASGSLALGFEFFVGAYITINAAHAIALRFGWKSADSMLTNVTPATASV